MEPDEIIDASKEPGDERECDFCGAQPVVYRFGARDHDQGDTLMADSEGRTILITGEALGDWLACADCKRTIQGADRDALSHGAVERYFKRRRTPPLYRPQLRQVFRQLHDQFWANRMPNKDRDLLPGEEIAPPHDPH